MTPQNNDWFGMFLATILGLAVAVALITLNLLFGAHIHYWLAELFI